MEKLKSTAELQEFAPFKQLTTASVALLRRGLQYKQCNKTVTLLRKGQKISGAYVVLAGQLRVFSLTPNGTEATLYVINPGETCVLALNCIFNDLRYPAWVEASPGTRVAVISGKTYRTLFETETEIRNITVQAFSIIVFRLMSELEGIHSFNLEQRLANFLLLHTSSNGIVRMTQQEIASHLGTIREVIARPLRQLVAQQYIETKRSHIVVKSMSKLLEVARGNKASSIKTD